MNFYAARIALGTEAMELQTEFYIVTTKYIFMHLSAFKTKKCITEFKLEKQLALYCLS